MLSYLKNSASENYCHHIKDETITYLALSDETTTIWMSHWCHTMLDGNKFWIVCKQLKLLRKAGCLLLIQNSMPSTIMLRQCDIWIRVPLKTMNNARIDSNRLLGIKSAIGFLRILNNLSICKIFYIWKDGRIEGGIQIFWCQEKFGY